ncbi:MAG: chromate transporter [Oscillospiraceae bacterium]|nr:chromate transporter [Oscillospiraceae bacterium]
MKKNMMLFVWFLKFGLITARDDYSIHDRIKSKFCPEYISAEEFDEKEQLLRDTPGPVGIKYAYFTGGKVNGIFGALFAAAATFLPVAAIAAALFFLYPVLFGGGASMFSVPAAGGIHAVTLGLIAAHIYKISYFNKLGRKSYVIILPAALIFLFIPSATTYMPFFIPGIIVMGIILGFAHDRLEKYNKSRPPKYIDPYSRKAKKLRDRQLREEEYDLMKYRDEKELKKLKEALKEKILFKKYKDND